MRPTLLIACIAAFGYVCWLTFFGTVSDFQVITAYIAASCGALALAKLEPVWASKVKWAWVALSLVLIYGIVTGPLDYLRLP